MLQDFVSELRDIPEKLTKFDIKQSDIPQIGLKRFNFLHIFLIFYLKLRILSDLHIYHSNLLLIFINLRYYLLGILNNLMFFIFL